MSFAAIHLWQPSGVYQITEISNLDGFGRLVRWCSNGRCFNNQLRPWGTKPRWRTMFHGQCQWSGSCRWILSWFVLYQTIVITAMSVPSPSFGHDVITGDPITSFAISR